MTYPPQQPDPQHPQQQRGAAPPISPAPSYMPGATPPVGGQPKPRRSLPLLAVIFGGLGLALVSCFGGVGIGAAGSTTATTATTAKAAPAPAASTVTKTVQLPAPAASTVTVTVTVTVQAPPPPPPAPSNTIADGTWTVGTDFPAGTYRTVGAGSDCYWKIAKSGSNGSDIIDNHIGGGNLTVTLKQGQDFETARCGTWGKVG